jgi:hypothetical protein
VDSSTAKILISLSASHKLQTVAQAAQTPAITTVVALKGRLGPTAIIPVPTSVRTSRKLRSRAVMRHGVTCGKIAKSSAFGAMIQFQLAFNIARCANDRSQIWDDLI